MDEQTRARIVWTAQRWVGVAYDVHHNDRSWATVSVTPRAFDAASFVCRVGMAALGYTNATLSNRPAWLHDNLVRVDAPAPGDVVCYARPGLARDFELGNDLAWHVMIYCGAGQVIGTCDLAGRVVVRGIEYGSEHGERQWHVASPPYRALRLRVD